MLMSAPASLAFSTAQPRPGLDLAPQVSQLLNVFIQNLLCAKHCSAKGSATRRTKIPGFGKTLVEETAMIGI